jgi:hypothetical protein
MPASPATLPKTLNSVFVGTVHPSGMLNPANMTDCISSIKSKVEHKLCLVALAEHQCAMLPKSYPAVPIVPARPVAIADAVEVGSGANRNHDLRVGDLSQAESFYHGRVGLDPTRRRSGAAFLSSGPYHHHLGINVWQSAGAGRRDETATGLAWFSLEVEKQDLFAAQEERLRQAGAQVAALANGLEAVDPWGTRVRLVKV